MKEILITGCRGQLGNEIQLLASEYPHFHFFFTDREELDITNEEQVMAFVEANKITTIINCATLSSVLAFPPSPFSKTFARSAPYISSSEATTRSV